MKEKVNKIGLRVFIINLLIMFWVILFRCNIASMCGKYNGIVLDPFSDVYNYTSKEARILCDIGNILCFIPSGIYLSLLIKNKISKPIFNLGLSVASILGISLFIEIIQYICCIGISSVSDVIMNLMGGVIGILLYWTLIKKIPDRVINKINYYIYLIFIPITIFCIINTLININLYI